MLPLQITFFYNVIIALNFVLCLDLILTLRDPFKKPESRYTMYSVIVVSMAMVPAVARLILVSSNPTSYGILVVALFCVYVLMAFFSAYVAY